MKNFTPEMIEKAKEAKSAEELLEIAKTGGIEMTADEAAKYFSQLNPKSGELDDDELDNVAGGACYNKNGYRKITNKFQKCDLFNCGCGAFNPVRFDWSANKCSNCNKIVACVNCVYKTDSEDPFAAPYCSNPATMKS